MYTVVNVPRHKRSPKWAKWELLDNKGKRVAYFQTKRDALDLAASIMDGAAFAPEEI